MRALIIILALLITQFINGQEYQIKRIRVGEKSTKIKGTISLDSTFLIVRFKNEQFKYTLSKPFEPVNNLEAKIIKGFLSEGFRVKITFFNDDTPMFIWTFIDDFEDDNTKVATYF